MLVPLSVPADEDNHYLNLYPLFATPHKPIDK